MRLRVMDDYSNVVDGSRLPERDMFTCRFCYKQFVNYGEFTVHERLHLEQMPFRGMFDNPMPPYSANTSSGTLDSFDKLIQPFRSSFSDATIRPTDNRILPPSSQPDLRNYVPSSSTDPRNIVSSPIDPRNMIATSPSDPRNLMPSSPAEQRNIIPSSPADPRNLIPSSPADSRNIASSSPAEPRNILPTSPADPRSLVPASPVDPRNMVPASPVDPRNMVPASPVDQRNMVPASPADPRNMVPASPVDPRNMVPASPVDPRNMVPVSPADPRNLIPGSPATQQDPRHLLVSSPASQPDKLQQIYRKDLDSQQNVNLIPRVTSINPQSPSMSMANVSMSTDVHSSTVDNRTPQVPDARRQPPLSVPLYLDALARRPTDNISNHPMSCSSFSSHTITRPEDVLGIDRQHNIPKVDAYYGIPKSHYHSAPGPDVGEGYASNQYGIGKLLSPPGQYYQQGVPPQSQATPYGIDKLTTIPLNYYNHPPNANDKTSVDQRDTLPTQTLHYGPSIQTAPVSNHSLYQPSIPHTNLQVNNSQLQKVPNSMDQSRLPQSGSDSPHSTYSQLYKGSHPHTQVYAPVPSHALPSQHDYKLSAEPVPSINLETRQKVRCTICQTVFNSLSELQTHLKSHVPEMIAQNKTNLSVVNHNKPPVQNFTPAEENIRMVVAQSTEMRQATNVEPVNVTRMNALNPVKPMAVDAMPFKCDCGRSFSKHAQYMEHAKTHTVSQQYECKICKKTFKQKSKCTRHEALHSGDIHLYYCEFCDVNFEQKGKYLQHIKRQHSQQDTVRSHQQREQQAGTKKAVPLTGGSIDTTFEGVEQEKFIDCQICDAEICKVDLYNHLKHHDIHACDKCDQVFLQKTECVAHLMSQHRNELDDSKSENVGGIGHSEQHKLVSMVESKVVNVASGEGDISGTVYKKVNKSRKEVIKDLKEKRKEVMKEKQKEIMDLKKQKIEKANIKIKSPEGNIVEKKAELNKSRPQMAMGEMRLKFGCSKCEKSFAMKSELTVHVQTHMKDPNKIYCEVCDYSYQLKEKGYYIYHMKYHRDHEFLKLDPPPQVPCIICNNKINKDNFVTHVKRAHSQYSCDICQWSYSSESSLVKHMRTIHVGKKYKNYVYDKSHYIENMVEPAPAQEQPVVYKKLKDIKAEQKSGEQSPAMVFPCQECSRTFTKKQYYERHVKTHSSSNDDGLISCEVCKLGFESRGTYIYHLQHHTENKVGNSDQLVNDLEGCKKEAEDNKMDVDQQDDNVKKLGNSFVKEKTPVVKQTYITVLNPETGDFEEQLIEEKDEPEIVFDIKLFEDPPNSEEKSVDVADNSNVSDVVSEIVYCKLCNKSLKRYSLPEHMQSHQTFNCDACQYSFTKKARYLDHCRILHLSDFIQKEVEQFEQAEKSQMEEASQHAHSGEQKEKDLHRRKKSTKVVNCSLCTTELKLDKFVEHIRTHLKPEFLCKFCERPFSKKTNLLIHEKSHDLISFGETELPYPKSCPYCEIPLKSRENYLTHLFEHSKKVPVKCKICEIVFTSEKNLENHVKTLHDQNIRVFWTHDGEGMKFDCKTGRIFEVYSDFLTEIKEINELFQQFGIAPIWTTAAPKKVKDKSSTPGSKNKINKRSKSNDEASDSVASSESEEKVKSETSDEDYVPERTLRKRKNAKSSSESDDLDDEDDEDYETEEESEAEVSRPVRKRKRSLRAMSEDSEQTDGYKPKGTKTRKLVKKTDVRLKKTVKKLKSIPGRVLRSTLDSKPTKNKEKRESLKRKPEENKSSSESPKKRRSEIDNLSFEEVVKVRESEDYPEKCPVCGIAQFSKSSYEVHSKIHSNDSSFICPVCKQTFTRKCNMLIHIKHRHKGYKPKNLRRREVKKPAEETKTTYPVRTRGRPSKTEPKSNQNLITPMKGSKLVVRLSPIDIEEKMRAVKEKGTGAISSDHKFLQSIEKKSHYSCEVCKKTFNQRWNYAQHIQGHKRDTKKKEKEAKTNTNKKDLKKKEKESKPFSCKDCSESFKKKRDLYIHTKIHFADPAEEDENPLNVSTTSEASVHGNTSEKELTEAENLTDSQNESYTDVNNSSVDESQLETSTVSDVNDKIEEPDKKSERGRRKSDAVSDTLKFGSEQNTSNAEVKNNNCEQNSNTGNEPSIDNVKNNGCETALLVAQNNNECHTKVADSEDEKSKLQRTPSVNKLSAETAVTKWKARVTELLSSQLELNATKKQEELSNPEVRKVKDYLSISGKGQKLKYECRICGDISDQEEVFRSHMDVHLNEPPPHCGKCDIYFMAIFPKRRLLEHNRKKHPELNL